MPPNFDLEAGDLPAKFAFDFDPAGSLDVLAEDGFGNSELSAWEQVPSVLITFDFSSNLLNQFTYTASDKIDAITLFPTVVQPSMPVILLNCFSSPKMVVNVSPQG